MPEESQLQGDLGPRWNADLRNRVHEVQVPVLEDELGLAKAKQAVLAALENDASSGAESGQPRRAELGRRASHVGIRALLGVAAAALALVWWAFAPTNPADSSRPGSLALAPTQASQTFTDGSVVHVTVAGTELESLVAEGPVQQVRLHRGAAQFHVRHQAGTDWRVLAGPHVVRVTGTTFDVAWAPQTQTFALELHEGAVVIEGPRGRHEVRPGEAVRWQGQAAERKSLKSTPGKPQANDPEPSGASSMSTGGVKPVAEAPARVNTRKARAGGVSPDWRTHHAAGRYREAVAAAKASGFERELAEAGAADLLDLADAARLAGERSLARRLLNGLREREAGSPEGGEAAYRLGRLLLRQDPREAARWFGTYVEEHPEGSLAREALARQLEALKASGQRRAARAVAERYLKQYPEGPSAALARGVLSR